MAESSVALSDGSILIGTRDTMLALYKDSKIFSFGSVTTAGGIHSMDITPDGVVYGVLGRDLGVGMLFSFTKEYGINLLGLLPEVVAESGRNAAIYRPSTLSVSPSGKYLAVGGSDEMGGVVVITL